MADAKLDLLLERMGELEPKLDGLMAVLKQFVQDEVKTQMAEQREVAKANDGN